ncbi:MAG: hypothetical protein HQ541_23000 [Mariniphaga sp.]|nr:hypothetical protein [Mariniphaga sp.]
MVKIIKIGFLFFVLISGNVFAQISPGDLTTAHAHLEGISNCTKCHVLGEKETTSKCLECHTEIMNLIVIKKGYHSSIEVKDKKCASCHGEHFGRDFIITRFDSATFNHNLSGYELIGKHQELSCKSCHTNSLIENKVSQKKEGSYLGLGTLCLSCHDDYHQETLPKDCATCHNQNKFKPASLFKHENSKFPLIGKHITVDCEKCHKIEIRRTKKF